MKLLLGKVSSLSFVLILSSIVIFAAGVIFYPAYQAYVPGGITELSVSQPDTTVKTRTLVSDTAFINLIHRADQYQKAGNLDACLSELEKAAKIHPLDSSLRNRITQVKGQIYDRDKKKNDYIQSITAGDAAFQKKDYLNAKAYYQLAMNAQPNDSLAKARLNTTMNLLRSQKAQNTLYDVAVANADRLLAAKEYDQAKTEYENASGILPNEAYPKARINEIIKLKVEEQVREEQYAQAIKNGDQYYNDKNWQPALLEYQSAVKLKPDEKYPRDRVAELTVLVEAQRKRDDAYIKSIGIADQLFESKSYPASRKEYENASRIKPEQSYPKTRMQEIDRLLAAIAKQQKDFDQYVNLADSFYIARNFIRARDYYVLASGAKPGEHYPREMLDKVNQFVSGQEAGEKASEEAYQSAIAVADKEFAAKNYDNARHEYQRAVEIKQTETYPKTKIQEIDGLLADLVKNKKRDENYQAAVSRGDSMLGIRDYDKARTAYTEASTLKPSETYPKEKLAAISTVLADQAKQKQEVEKEYADLVLSGEKLFKSKSLEPAKVAFSKALELKPGESLPKRRIASIDSLSEVLAKQKSLDDQYSGIIAAADKLLLDKSFDAARSEYLKASVLKPSETYPKIKIREIDKSIADLAVAKAKDSTYAADISEGDRLLAAKSYDPAKAEYQKALKIKPDEAYPKGKIDEIDLALAEIARLKSTNEKYQMSIGKADKLLASKSYTDARLEYTNAAVLKPSETYPAQKIGEIDKIVADSIAKQKSLEEQYSGLIAGADKLLQDKSYTQARTQYNKALTLKPSETYPKTKISEIDKILADLAVAKAKDSTYAASISEGDKLLASKSYDQAKTEYQKALKIKPDEAYPKGRIGEIDQALADIAKQKSTDETYQQSISKADKLLASKSYTDARQEYTNAAALKPSETYPAQKIGEIDKILAEIARQKALDEQYGGIIASAEKLFAAKTLDQAKSAFQKALELKPAEELPKRRIASIDSISDVIAKQTELDQQYKGIIAGADKLLQDKSYEQSRAGYLKASELKAAETYPKTKISEIDRILANLAASRARDSAYAAAVASGDKLMASKTWDQAKTEYQRALQLKPDEAYPKTKITEADNAMAEAARQKALDEKYQAAIQKADQLLLSGDLAQARAAYVEAGKIKPGEAYPQDKIKETDGRIAEAARLKTLEDRYKTSIGKADQLLTAKSYDQAKTEFNNALSIKPGEQYPSDKIKEIESILTEIRAREEAYKASVLKADQMLSDKKFDEARTEYENALTIKPNEQYPKNKIDEINKKLVELQGRKKTFDDLVIKGDNSFNDKDWGKSREYFQQASGLFPEEKYPKDRLERLTTVIDSIYRANKGKYDKAIAEADKFYNGFEFDKAIDGYTEAAGYLPMENYPKEMIARIRRTLAENAIADVLNSPVTITSNDEKQFRFTPVNIASRKDNFIYIKLRNLSGKPFNVLLRYGKDKQPSGGIVIRNLSTDGKINERLISVREQDVWYRIDNDFISLYPQGGDIEVSFIQVSKAR